MVATCLCVAGRPGRPGLIALRGRAAGTLSPPHLLPPAAFPSKPAITADPASPTSGLAYVTPPGNNRPWAWYDIHVCVAGTADCRNLNCTASSSPNGITTCAIPDCTPATTYSVVATAHQANLTSPASDADSFVTDAFP